MAVSSVAAAPGRGGTSVSGGSAAHRATVSAALDASSLDWRHHLALTVQVRRGLGVSYAEQNRIVLDARLLESGRFAWGVVLHELGHVVDLQLLTPEDRAVLARALGARTWWDWEDPTVPHAALGSERFATMFAWAYWQSPANAFSPASTGDRFGIGPARFRAVLADLTGLPQRAG